MASPKEGVGVGIIMEAKDTVMDKHLLKSKWLEYQAEENPTEPFSSYIAKEQAEISFKAGEKLSLEKQGQAYLKGKQSGIKEVVEWGNDICVMHGDVDSRIRLGIILPTHACEQCWKEKEWGIE